MCLVRKLSACLFLLLSVGVSAQQSAPVEDGPEVWKARGERADTLRRDARALREKADVRRAQEDLECRSSFFENACRDSARDTWLEQVNAARAMEMEAVGLERSIRAHELAMRERNRPPRTPKASTMQWMGAPTGPAPTAAKPAESQSAPQLNKREPVAPRAPLKPLSAEEKAERASNRQQAAEAAAARAARAKEDAARYAERQRAHAAKKASSAASK